jgi:hypothetical protein
MKPAYPERINASENNRKNKPMKTTINIAELVDAYRAQEQEKIEARLRKEAERKAHLDSIYNRCVAAAADLLPTLQEVVALLPCASFVKYSPYSSRTQINLSFSFIYTNDKGDGHLIARLINVCYDSEGDTIKYFISPDAYVRGRSGLLDFEGPLRINKGVISNPTDIIVAVAEQAGICRARNLEDGTSIEL